MKHHQKILTAFRYFCLLIIVVFGWATIVGTGGSSSSDSKGGNKVSMKDYFGYEPGEVRVYKGTWDSDDIRIEAVQGTEYHNVNGATEEVWIIENYNLTGDNIPNYVYTAYEYSDGTSWIMWKEEDWDGSTSFQNFELFHLFMAPGDTTSDGVELVETGSKIFTELSGAPLEYAKLNVPSPFDSGFWIVYYIKDYGEYVLEYNQENDSFVQKFLIYSEYSDGSSIGTKPHWFDYSDF